MSSLQIDAMYEAFADSLPASLRSAALQLPFTLKLAPIRHARFSEVFSHEVTLGAPFLVAEAFPNAPAQLVRSAGLAHLLAVIEAFGTDRVADRQVEPLPEVLTLLDHLRRARDRALEQTLPGALSEGPAADDRTGHAIAEERDLLGRVAAIDFERYAAVSRGKQAVGFPASIALARALGARDRQLLQIERLLTGVWLGLQFEDDVIDWEGDWQQGGAWAVCLARGVRQPVSNDDDQPTEPDLIRTAVLTTGVLRRMLELSRRNYRNAWRHGRALGAFRLSKWAKARELRLQALIPLEARYAGYAVRARKLGPWAVEVLT